MSSGRSLSGPHILWSGGHALVVLASLYELFAVLTLKQAPKAHRLALTGALTSWGIVVCVRSMARARPDVAASRRWAYRSRTARMSSVLS